jgi:hypothetical protein
MWANNYAKPYLHQHEPDYLLATEILYEDCVTTPLPIHSHLRNNLGLKLVNIDVEKPRNQALPLLSTP